MKAASTIYYSSAFNYRLLSFFCEMYIYKDFSAEVSFSTKILTPERRYNRPQLRASNVTTMTFGGGVGGGDCKGLVRKILF